MYRTGRYSEGDLSKIFQAVTKLEEFFDPIFFVNRGRVHSDGTVLATSSYNNEGRQLIARDFNKLEASLKRVRGLLALNDNENEEGTHPHDMLLALSDLTNCLEGFTDPHHQKGGAGFRFESGFRILANSITNDRRRETLKKTYRGGIPDFFETDKVNLTIAYINWLKDNIKRAQRITRDEIQELRGHHQVLADIIHKDVNFERVVSKQEAPLP